MVWKLRGRKRKAGVVREKNGREQREKLIDVLTIAESMPHRRWIPGDRKRDQKAECPFGRLALIGAITGAEYEAGQRFLTDVRKYRVVIDSPREGAPSLTGKLSRSDYSEGDAPIPLRVIKPLSDEEATSRTKAYNEAFIVARTDERGQPSRYTMTVLNSVLVHERDLQPGDLPFLRAALGRLEKHYTKPKVRQARTA